MGSTVPASGHVSNSARTTTEVKNDLEYTNDVLRRMIGSSTALTAVTISAGGLTATTGSLYVSPEGGTPDNLDTISPTAYSIGSVICLEAASGATITVRHDQGGTGEILLSGTSTFEMSGASRIWLRLDNSTQWSEIDRTYGTNVAAFRSYLGLGTAALGNTGSGNGFNADLLDGQHAAAFLGVAATAANATQLGGVAASDYVSKSVAALQTFAHNLEVGQGRFYVNHPSLSQSSGIEINIAGQKAAQLIYEDAAQDTISLQIYTPGAGTALAGLRLNGAGANAGKIRVWNGGAWVQVYDPATGWNADAVLDVDASSVFGTGGTSEHIFTSAQFASSGDKQTFNVTSSMCWCPRIVVTTYGATFVSRFIQGYGLDETSTGIEVECLDGAPAYCQVFVRYVIGDPPVNV